MIEWLKTSIPGILILGACGSFAATIAWKLFSWVLRRVLPESARKILIFEYRDSFRRGYIRAWQETEQRPYETMVYFSYALARLIGSLTLVVCFLMLSCVYLTTKDDNAVVSGLGLISVILLFLSVYWCWRHYRPLREAFNEVIMPIIKNHDRMTEPPNKTIGEQDVDPNA